MSLANSIEGGDIEACRSRRRTVQYLISRDDKTIDVYLAMKRYIDVEYMTMFRECIPNIRSILSSQHQLRSDKHTHAHTDKHLHTGTQTHARTS